MTKKLLNFGLVLILLAGLGWNGRGQGPVVRVSADGGLAPVAGIDEDDAAFLRRLADIVLTDGQAYENLRVLTKKVGARLSGSPGYYKAEKWGMKALQEAQVVNKREMELGAFNMTALVYLADKYGWGGGQ
jgi:hypothetical protein